MSEATFDIEELVETYIEIRGQREQALKNYEAIYSALKQELSEIESALLGVCNNLNANSIRTDHGTVTRKLNERFYCNDWENFHRFIKEHDVVELLEKRIDQGNFKQFLADHSDDGLPPGVNVMREFGIVVRKPSNK